MSAAAHDGGAAPAGGLDALRQVKQAEEEVAQSLDAVKRDGEAQLQKVAEETAASLASARAEAEARKTAILAGARAAADQEAATILAEGRRQADALERAARDVNERREAVLQILLGEFRGKGASGG